MGLSPFPLGFFLTKYVIGLRHKVFLPYKGRSRLRFLSNRTCQYPCLGKSVLLNRVDKNFFCTSDHAVIPTFDR